MSVVFIICEYLGLYREYHRIKTQLLYGIDASSGILDYSALSEHFFSPRRLDTGPDSSSLSWGEVISESFRLRALALGSAIALSYSETSSACISGCSLSIFFAPTVQAVRCYVDPLPHLLHNQFLSKGPVRVGTSCAVILHCKTSESIENHVLAFPMQWCTLVEGEI